MTLNNIVTFQSNEWACPFITGLSVGRLKEYCRDLLNVPTMAIALVNARYATADYHVCIGDHVEFVVLWGEKGGGDASADRLMTVKEAALELRCSISFVYKLMKLGELSYEQRGRRKLPIDRSIREYRSRSIVHGLLMPQSETSPAKRYRHLFN
jgi:excisionase family DNA binding protein